MLMKLRRIFAETRVDDELSRRNGTYCRLVMSLINMKRLRDFSPIFESRLSLSGWGAISCVYSMPDLDDGECGLLRTLRALADDRRGAVGLVCSRKVVRNITKYCGSSICWRHVASYYRIYGIH